MTDTQETRPEPPRWPALALALVAGGALGALLWQQFAPAQRAADPLQNQQQVEKLVRETILANPEIIPEAINRLQQREVERLLASNREAIETPFAGAFAGGPDADVTLVEFFDFNCPFCRQGKADIDRLLAEDPKLKLVWRDFPVLGPASDRFALASLSAARQGRYRQFLDATFSMGGRLTEERLIQAIRRAGLNERQVAEDLKSAELRREIESNLDLGRALGLTGTPSYIIGNKIISGAVGYEELKAAIAEARANPAPSVPLPDDQAKEPSVLQ